MSQLSAADIQKRLLLIGNAAKARNPTGFVDEVKRRVGDGKPAPPPPPPEERLSRAARPRRGARRGDGDDNITAAGGDGEAARRDLRRGAESAEPRGARARAAGRARARRMGPGREPLRRAAAKYAALEESAAVAARAAAARVAELEDALAAAAAEARTRDAVGAAAPRAQRRADAPAAAAATPRGAVDAIRASRLVDVDLSGCPAAVASGARASSVLAAAAERLSVDLYEHRDHFLHELFQNADDARHDGVDAPALEAGDAATTGHKGIGFKAVFAMCDRPCVLSNGFAFYFDGATARWASSRAGSSSTAPTARRRRPATSSTAGARGARSSPCRSPTATPATRGARGAEAPRLLLFARRLASLAVTVDGATQTWTATRGPGVARRRRDRGRRRRDDASDRPARPAFRAGGPERPAFYHAVLPVAPLPASFGFSLSAPFDLVASRAALRATANNVALRAAVADAFAAAVASNDELRGRALDYLGSEDRAEPPFWAALRADIFRYPEAGSSLRAAVALLGPRARPRAPPRARRDGRGAALRARRPRRLGRDAGEAGAAAGEARVLGRAPRRGAELWPRIRALQIVAADGGGPLRALADGLWAFDGPCFRGARNGRVYRAAPGGGAARRLLERLGVRAALSYADAVDFALDAAARTAAAAGRRSTSSGARGRRRGPRRALPRGRARVDPARARRGGPRGAGRVLVSATFFARVVLPDDARAPSPRSTAARAAAALPDERAISTTAAEPPPTAPAVETARSGSRRLELRLGRRRAALRFGGATRLAPRYAAHGCEAALARLGVEPRLGKARDFLATLATIGAGRADGEPGDLVAVAAACYARLAGLCASSAADRAAVANAFLAARLALVAGRRGRLVALRSTEAFWDVAPALRHGAAAAFALAAHHDAALRPFFVDRRRAAAAPGGAPPPSVQQGFAPDDLRGGADAAPAATEDLAVAAIRWSSAAARRRSVRGRPLDGVGGPPDDLAALAAVLRPLLAALAVPSRAVAVADVDRCPFVLDACLVLSRPRLAARSDAPYIVTEILHGLAHAIDDDHGDDHGAAAQALYAHALRGSSAAPRRRRRRR
ncbi:hypothetical protein JL722_8023 [Aureococcus anophagefferens]|nr:hypothetical protein JL722_8023 [Aureococcus anophagefferens]